ncbi:tif471, partial [Symbiodinium necroappetens]
ALSKESSDDSFVKNLRSILNKLTVEKFDTLSDQIIELVSQSDRPNRGIPLLMQLVFEKATTQHHFINMYVGLCVKLHKWLTENDHIDGAESQSNFKRVLLNQCQSSFEQYLEPPEGFDGLTGDDLYEAQVKYKTKMLGNIRLVGELIRHGMLAPKIAIAVASELARDDPAVRSERLETLATFLETVGVALDDPSWKHHHELELVFEQVTRACSDQTVPRRVRCLLQDVLDLRNGGWKSKRRKDLSKETPQTLAQVHEKAKADQATRRDTSKSLCPTRGLPSGAVIFLTDGSKCVP